MVVLQFNEFFFRFLHCCRSNWWFTGMVAECICWGNYLGIDCVWIYCVRFVTNDGFSGVFVEFKMMFTLMTCVRPRWAG